MHCPYGGICIDPGNPSDCQANRACVDFSSVEEKKKFDSQPDRYYFQYPEGGRIKFKNQTQLDFFLGDTPKSIRNKASWGNL